MTQSNSNPERLSVHLQGMLERVAEVDKKREAAKVYQLSLWQDQQRGVPNEFVRSALFSAIQPNKSQYMRGETIFSQNGFTITFTGRQLTQCDLDVWVEMHKRGKSFTGNWESLVWTRTLSVFPAANFAPRELPFFENEKFGSVSSNGPLLRQFRKPRFSGLKRPICPELPSQQSISQKLNAEAENGTPEPVAMKLFPHLCDLTLLLEQMQQFPAALKAQ